ncbi:tyrosine-type recombinase/integrase [Patescibacteria group bacterium]
MNNDIKIIEKSFRKARILGELSDSSVLKYRDSIKKFFTVIKKDIAQLDLDDFDDFILEMKDGGASNSRIANVISAVKWILNRLQLDGVTGNSLDLGKIRKPKIERKPVEYLNDNEIKKFIGCISDDIKKGIAIRKVRMMALVMLLLESGSRIGEALSIKINDIDWDNKEIPVIGKGKKSRSLFFRDGSQKWIRKYLEIRKSDNEYLFVTLKGESVWSQTDVGRSFRRYRELSGIKKNFTPHTLRHTTATQLVFRGAQFNDVQYILGHSRLETTVKHYIGATEKRRVKQIMQDKHYDFISESEIIY